MTKIKIKDVVYQVYEYSNGSTKTLIDILKEKVFSYLLEEKNYYDTIILSQGSFVQGGYNE